MLDTRDPDGKGLFLTPTSETSKKKSRTKL